MRGNSIYFYRKSVLFLKIVGLYYRIMMLSQGSVSKAAHCVNDYAQPTPYRLNQFVRKRLDLSVLLLSIGQGHCTDCHM